MILVPGSCGGKRASGPRRLWTVCSHRLLDGLQDARRDFFPCSSYRAELIGCLIAPLLIFKQQSVLIQSCLPWSLFPCGPLLMDLTVTIGWWCTGVIVSFHYVHKGLRNQSLPGLQSWEYTWFWAKLFPSPILSPYITGSFILPWDTLVIMTSALACSDPPCGLLFTQNRKEVRLLCAEAEPQEKAEPMWFTEWKHWTITSNLLPCCLKQPKLVSPIYCCLSSCACEAFLVTDYF